jgi:hypothetical protein
MFGFGFFWGLFLCVNYMQALLSFPRATLSSLIFLFIFFCFSSSSLNFISLPSQDVAAQCRARQRSPQLGTVLLHGLGSLHSFDCQLSIELLFGRLLKILDAILYLLEMLLLPLLTALAPARWGDLAVGCMLRMLAHYFSIVCLGRESF